MFQIPVKAPNDSKIFVVDNNIFTNVCENEGGPGAIVYHHAKDTTAVS